MKQNFDCVSMFFVLSLKKHLKEKDHLRHMTLLYYIQTEKQDVTTRIVKLQFEVDPIVVLQVWIINIPVPPFPKRGCHFIQKLALCFVTEYMLPQALSSGGILLPQLLLVSSLFTPESKKSDWKHLETNNGF